MVCNGVRTGKGLRSACWVVVWCWVAAMGGGQSSHATVGWGPADMIFDYGVEVEPGDYQLFVDGLDLDAPIDGEIYWKGNGSSDTRAISGG